MNTRQQISQIPLPIVIGAFIEAFGGGNIPATKTEMVDRLAQSVDQGLLTVDTIKRAPAKSRPAPTPIDPFKIEAVSTVANQAHQVALETKGLIRSHSDEINSLVKVAKNQQATIDTLLEKVDTFKVDDSRITAEVSKVIADAFKPFRTAVEQAGAQTVVADLSSVFATDSVPAHDLFGLPSPVLDNKGNMIMVSVWNHPDAPAIDPDFIWTEGIVRHLCLSDRTGDHLWFAGDKGTGKSETVRQFCARTGRGFKRINFHKHTSTEEYLGAVGLVNGATVFQPKDFLTAYTAPSTVILLDEVTNADAGELAPLNGFLEPNPCVSFGGQRWTKATGVFVVVADNTFGSGDETGRYAGTRTQNSALVDRFSRVIQFDFLPRSEEVSALSARANCTRQLAAHVLEAIAVCRSKVQTGDIVDAPSIRSAIAFIRALMVISPKDAWASAVVARQPSESHAALWSVFESQINLETIQQNL